MHVLQVLNSTSGGSAQSTIELAAELQRLGITSYLICDNNGTRERRKYLREIFDGRAYFFPLYWMNKKIRAKTWKRPLLEGYHLYRTWAGFKYQKQIQQIIQEQEIDLIHTSTILTPEGAYAAKAMKIPHIWHVRELLGPGKHFQFYRYKKWANFIANHSQVLVANSEASLACLQPYFPNEKIVKIANAINTEVFTVKEHKNISPITIGMVGNVTSKWKNHRFFIEVAAALRRRKAFCFKIYGKLPTESDPYLRGLKQLVKELELSDKNFAFAGFEKPEKIMQNIDILFHPTELESFGRIFVEAMAAGLPVIGINEGGATEMIQHGLNGYLANKNVNEIKDHIQNLAIDPSLRQKMGAHGRKIARAEYNLPILGQKMKMLYTQVLKKQATWIS